MQDQSVISIEHISTFYMVKYDQMHQLVNMALNGYGSREITLYIDLYGLYKTIISRRHRTDTSDYTAMVPAIINICVHYRQFFKKLGVYCHIFLISSYNVPEINRKMVAGYNRTMMEKLRAADIAEMVDFNIELLEILCPYLPDIYFIKTKFESSVVMNHLIQMEWEKGHKCPVMIISTDIMPAQLTTMYDHVCFLRPKKNKGVDNSTIIYPRGQKYFENSFYLTVYADNRFSAPELPTPQVHPSNYMLLSALTSFSPRDIKLLANPMFAKKLIRDVVGDHRMDMTALYLLSPVLQDRYPQAILEARFNVLDIPSMMVIFNNDMEIYNISYENLIDPGALQMINSKYFANNPIDLYRLQ